MPTPGIELSVSAMIFIVAALYSSVGHGGASGYLAVLSLFGYTPEVMATTALILNVLVAGLSTCAYVRAGHFCWRLIWPFLVGSIPAAFIGGALRLPAGLYYLLLALTLILVALRLFFDKGADTPGQGMENPIHRQGRRSEGVRLGKESFQPEGQSASSINASAVFQLEQDGTGSIPASVAVQPESQSSSPLPASALDACPPAGRDANASSPPGRAGGLPAQSVRSAQTPPSLQRLPPCSVGIICDALIGLLSGMVGIGGGVFLTPLLVLMRWAPAKAASAASAIFIVINSIAGLIGRGTAGQLELGVAPPLIIAAFTGGLLGSYWGARFLSELALRRLLALVLVIASAKLVLVSGAFGH